MKVVWNSGNDGVISSEVWSHVNLNLVGKTISRASIINFLNAMVVEGVLDYEEESGKGGYHRVYKPKFNEKGFRRYLAEKLISSLMNDFPNETKEVLGSLEY